MSDRYDVLVVGGGPSGAAAAYWLAQQGWRVLVVEKKRFPREKTCGDRKSTRLNSSHRTISYAVFCLKKKKKTKAKKHVKRRPQASSIRDPFRQTVTQTP